MCNHVKKYKNVDIIERVKTIKSLFNLISNFYLLFRKITNLII